MASKVSIEDITTLNDLSSSPLESYAVINENDLLDKLEFSIGIERGEITKYAESFTIKMRKDMIPLFQQHNWALIPSPEVLSRIKELFFLNHENAPRHRLMFTDVIPIAEYEYQFYCPNVKKAPPFYIRGKRYAYPFTDLPSIWSTLHPCFAIPSALGYFAHNFDAMKAKKMSEADMLCLDIGLSLRRHLYLSWVKTVKTKDLGRPMPSAKHDPPDTNPIVRSKLLQVKKATNAKKAASEDIVESVPLARHDPSDTNSIIRPTPLKVKKAAKAKKVRKAVSGPAKDTAEPEVRRKRKLSNLTATSTEDDAPPPKRRSPRFT